MLAGVLGYFWGDPYGGFGVSLQNLLILALMGPLQLSIPLVFYAKGAKAVPAVTLTLVSMLDVVLNPFWAWIGAGELPSQSAYLGGGIIVAAVLISIFGEQWLKRSNGRG